MTDEKKTKQTLLDKAWDLFYKERYNEALASLQRLKKKTVRTFYLEGLIFYHLNNFTGAFDSLNNALLYKKDNMPDGFIHYWIAKIYGHNVLFEDYDNPLYNPQKAEEHFLISSDKESFPPDTLFELAKLRKSNEEKEQFFLKGNRVFPKNVDFYCHLSRIYYNLKYIKKEKEILLAAIQNKIDSSSIYFLIGQIFYREKKYKESINYFEKATPSANGFNDYSVIYYQWGLSEYFLSQFEESFIKFNKSVEYNPLNSNSWLPRIGYILTLSKLNRNNEIKEYIESIPFDRKLFAYISFRHGFFAYLDSSMSHESTFDLNHDEAIRLLEPILKEKTNEELRLKTCLILAALYCSNDDHKNELKYFREIKSYSYQYDYIDLQLKECYLLLINNSAELDELADLFLKDIENGGIRLETIESILTEMVQKLSKVKKYKKIVEICNIPHRQELIPNDIIFEYAYSLHELDQYDRAKYYYEKYLSYYPKSSAALNNLGNIYDKSKFYEKAISLYKAALKIDPRSELYQRNLKNSTEALNKKSELERKNLIPKHWLLSGKELTVEALTKIEYFDIISKISKINKKYKVLLERDYKELVLNYIIKNNKSIVVLSGSLVELALTYYCEKKKVNVLEITKGREKNRIKLYDAVLNDLIIYVNNQKWFGNDFHYLGNLSRIYRNFIHPGMELKSKDIIGNKADLCYLSTIEILKKVLG